MRKIKKKKVSPSAEYVLVLRTCDAEMKAYNRFQWPRIGPVKCPDWSPEAVCGRGLHGLLWGEGDGEQLNWNEGANWLVVRVLASDIVQLDRKVKFPAGEVVFCGDQNGATKYLLAAPEGRGRAISGAVVLAGRGEAATAGYKGTATAGYKGTATAGESGTATAGYKGTATAGESGTATAGNWGTATAGDWGTATAGNWGTATAGNWGTATAGNWGTATAGNWGTATAGESGTATAGNWGTATAGYKGTATAGESGTATAGNWGTATAGNWGTATAGNWGTATAGKDGVLCIKRWDGKRYRLVVGYVGEEGILADKYYRLDDAGKFIPATDVDAAMAAKKEGK
jgi:hypothetical protein